MTTLRCEHLSLSYGEYEAIKDVSFSVKEGEILTIIGPNGSGKSTILRGISKLLPIEKGKIFLWDREVSDMSFKELACQVGMLLQYNQSPPDLTVRDLVYYGRLPRKKWYEGRTVEDERLVDHALYETRLTEYAKKRIIELSGGERQRVWLAMALAQRPSILLLDEPTTYLDIAYQLELLELIRHLNQKNHMTVVMVLHDLNQAARYSDRLVIMRKKGIYAMGTPKEVMTSHMLEEVFSIHAQPVILDDGEAYLVPLRKVQRENP